MNKRIKELAKQAGMEDYPTEGINAFYGDRYIERFAELIIQECIDVLAVYRTQVVFTDGVEHNCQHPITAIQQHFGLKP